MSEHDINEPILVVLRRGRNGRGFSVSPIDDIPNPALCLDGQELGNALIEMLDDPRQARVNINDLLSATEEEEKKSNDDSSSEDSESDEEKEEEGSGGIFDGVKDAEDPADALLINILSAALQKGREMSDRSKRRRGGRSRRRK